MSVKTKTKDTKSDYTKLVKSITKDSSCHKARFWRFGDNFYHKNDFDFDTAKAAALTLVNCRSCFDCTDCIDCKGCSDCIRCRDCKDCKDCSDCTDCRDCKGLTYEVGKSGISKDRKPGDKPISKELSRNKEIDDLTENDIIKDNTYWLICDNAYKKSTHSFAEAKEAAKTMVNCYACIDCTNCTDCTSCRDCHGCNGLSYEVGKGEPKVKTKKVKEPKVEAKTKKVKEPKVEAKTKKVKEPKVEAKDIKSDYIELVQSINEDSSCHKNKFWRFGDNFYYKSGYDFDTAKIAALTLVNCRGCYDCIDCKDCVHCIRCRDCIGCRDSVGCEGCEGCEGCKKCEYCTNCKSCTGLIYPIRNSGINKELSHNKEIDDLTEDDIIKDSKYWIIHNNAYSKDTHSFAEAKEAAKTLVNCHTCIDCTNCTDCTGCTNCHNCDGLDGSVSMGTKTKKVKEPKVEAKVESKKDSKYAKLVESITEDSSCHTDCFWHFGSNIYNKDGFDFAKAKLAVATLVNCTECIDCIDCTDCNDCADCNDCNSCTECTDCIDCNSCTECTSCESCTDCTDCHGCRECHGCNGLEDALDMGEPKVKTKTKKVKEPELIKIEIFDNEDEAKEAIVAKTKTTKPSIIPVDDSKRKYTKKLSDSDALCNLIKEVKIKASTKKLAVTSKQTKEPKESKFDSESFAKSLAKDSEQEKYVKLINSLTEKSKCHNSSDWMFDGNSYDKAKFSFKEAQKAALTLVNCIDCRDCIRCVNCDNSSRCTNCTDCSWCSDCKDLTNGYKIKAKQIVEEPTKPTTTVKEPVVQPTVEEPTKPTKPTTTTKTDDAVVAKTKPTTKAKTKITTINDITEDSPCHTDEFWVFLTNKYAKTCYTFDKAKASVLTLTKCTNCENCENCTNCTDCELCDDCTNCTECRGCKRCHGCHDCFGSNDCRDSKGLEECNDCNDCNNCDVCTNCNGTNDRSYTNHYTEKGYKPSNGNNNTTTNTVLNQTEYITTNQAIYLNAVNNSTSKSQHHTPTQWVFVTNVYDKDIYTFNEAQKAALTLVGCYSCTNCVECTECTRCTNCIKCKNCYNCNGCDKYENCENCNDSHDQIRTPKPTTTINKDTVMSERPKIASEAISAMTEVLNTTTELTSASEELMNNTTVSNNDRLMALKITSDALAVAKYALNLISDKDKSTILAMSSDALTLSKHALQIVNQLKNN